MSVLLSPNESGGFQNRTDKMPLHELLKLSTTLVNELGSPFSMRLSLSNKVRCIYKFNKIPTIPVDLPVPDLDAERFSMDGWDHLMIDHAFHSDKVVFTLKGKFGKERKDSYFVDVTLVRLFNGETENDVISTTDPEGNEAKTSVFELMQIRNNSGDPVYARFSDEYPSLDTEGITFIITRYIKSLKAQAAAPAPVPAV